MLGINIILPTVFLKFEISRNGQLVTEDTRIPRMSDARDIVHFGNDHLSVIVEILSTNLKRTCKPEWIQ